MYLISDLPAVRITIIIVEDVLFIIFTRAGDIFMYGVTFIANTTICMMPILVDVIFLMEEMFFFL